MLQLDHTRKAVRYRRVSSRSQKDNFSLRTQEIRSTQYCESIGVPIDRIFTDVGTGLTAKGRRGFTEMCDYVLDKTNGITDVVFNDIDRFTRNLGDFIEYTERHGQGLHHIAHRNRRRRYTTTIRRRNGLTERLPRRRKADGSRHAQRAGSEPPPNWVTTSAPHPGATISSTRATRWTRAVITPFAANWSQTQNCGLTSSNSGVSPPKA